MEHIFLALIGITMGFLGGMLGIGGSIVMIPSLVFVFGENQHVYQASAMICNFFVGIGSISVHLRKRSMMPHILKQLVPSAVLSAMAGVFVSNSQIFSGGNSYILARIFGVFLLYVIFYNVIRLRNRHNTAMHDFDISHTTRSGTPVILCGILSGFTAGLLGIGGGIILVPAQQLFLKMPIKRAVINSAATIVAIALAGALYKNLSLCHHGLSVLESLKIAIFIIPGALAGSIIGSRVLHKLPVKVVRIVFICLAIPASYKLIMLTGI